MGRGRGGLLRFGVMSPMGPLFLSHNSLSAKWLPRLYTPCLPCFLGGREALLLCSQQHFPLFVSFFCAAAWSGEESFHLCLLLNMGEWILRQLLTQGLPSADAPES